MLENRRQDKRASKQRAAIRYGMNKLQTMGCASSYLGCTRVGNTKVYCTKEVIAIRQSAPHASAGLRSISLQQGEAIKRMRLDSGAAAPSTAAAASMSNESLSAAVPSVPVRPRGANLGVLSHESAVENVVRQWQAKRLACATVPQLELYLNRDNRALRLTKDILLQKAAARLLEEYPEGER